MLYTYPKLSEFDFIAFRVLGSGLGNLLLPWARSVAAAEKYGLKTIEPTWPQIKIGTFLRGESDLRFYGNFFSAPAGSIHGAKKLFLLQTNKKINESALPGCLQDKDRIKNGIFVFNGMKNYFKDILADHELIRRELIKRVRDLHKKGLNYDFEGCVSLHIRQSDFKLLKWDTSIEWFLLVMDELKNKLGSDVKFKIFSDGSDDDLALILSRKNTERMFFGSALADLLALSRSRVLVGSANSTFSMWASYLGRMPTIWSPGGLLQVLHFEKPGNEIETDFLSPLPAGFLDMCKKSLHY